MSCFLTDTGRRLNASDSRFVADCYARLSDEELYRILEYSQDAMIELEQPQTPMLRQLQDMIRDELASRA